MDLPPEETAIQKDVDHWGLPFSDQLRAFDANFRKFAKATGKSRPNYILGVETSLRKTLRNKYWFKGAVGGAAELCAGKNESQAFQLAIIPKTGFELKKIVVSVSALTRKGGKGKIPAEAVRLWRVGFVKTVPAQYPTRHVGDWPDPLLQLRPFSLKGLDLGLIWCEVKVPRDAAAGDYTGEITVTPANAAATKLTIKLRVWDFTLPDRVRMPMIVWMKGKPATQEFRDVAGMFLEHHLDPVDLGGTNDLAVLDKNLEFGFRRGLMYFTTPRLKKPAEFQPYYEHIKAKGWLDKAIMYGAQDEPTAEQLRKKVIPATTIVRKQFPGLKVYLASEYHDGIDRGVDFWMTDVSTNFHSWLAAGRPGKQQLWWYFCHLPVRVGMERPLVDAPNMEIDNDAIEHRLPYWMARHYGVKGMFIWAGTRGWPGKPDQWAKKGFPLTKTKPGFPYGGIHNGNGYLLYPGPRPSIRLKVLRDGAQDYWYLRQVEKLSRGGKARAQAKALLDGITPAVFVDTHYFRRDPAVLLAHRRRLGEFIEQAAR